MYDPLKRAKTDVKLAAINARLAKNQSQRQIADAKSKSLALISSPAGIATMFAAGGVKGAMSAKPKSGPSLLLPLLLKLF